MAGITSRTRGSTALTPAQVEGIAAGMGLARRSTEAAAPSPAVVSPLPERDARGRYLIRGPQGRMMRNPDYDPLFDPDPAVREKAIEQARSASDAQLRAEEAAQMAGPAGPPRPGRPQPVSTMEDGTLLPDVPENMRDPGAAVIDVTRGSGLPAVEGELPGDAPATPTPKPFDPIQKIAEGLAGNPEDNIRSMSKADAGVTGDTATTTTDGKGKRGSLFGNYESVIPNYLFPLKAAEFMVRSPLGQAIGSTAAAGIGGKKLADYFLSDPSDQPMSAAEAEEILRGYGVPLPAPAAPAPQPMMPMTPPAPQMPNMNNKSTGLLMGLRNRMV